MPARYASDYLALTYEDDFFAQVGALDIVEPARHGDLLAGLPFGGAAGVIRYDSTESHPDSQLQECVVTAVEVTSVPKPHAQVELANLVHRADSEPAGEQSAVTQRPPRVLIVEDQLVVRRLFKTALERHGVVVDEAANGVAGLTLLQANEYDCVFSGVDTYIFVSSLTTECDRLGILNHVVHGTDMWMPEMNGDEMVAAFRAWEAGHRQQRQRIIAVSAVNTAEVRLGVGC